MHEDSQLILADGLAADIGRLLEGAQAPLLRVGEVADPVRAISLALAGESVDVLHIVAHGRREGFRLGGHWVDAAALRAQAYLVAGWNVRRIALWSCSVGQGSALVRTLARLTGAQVFASDRPLGRVGEERLWRLHGEGEGAPQAPFAAPVLAAWDHQLASLTFSQVWQVTNTADKESNNHTFNYATPLFSAADGTIVDGTTSRTFTGNDVSATLTIPGMAQPVYGWISRPIKVGGQVVGFYMWTDSDFTSLALAQADGNADADGNTAQNTGYILAVPGKESYFISGSIGSSSDRVDTALNSLIPVNSAPVAKNDTATLNEDAVNATGSVLTNDTDANSDTLVVTGFSYTVNGTTTSVTVTTSTAGSASIAGVGSFTLASNGTWTFSPEANYTGPVPVFTYTVADPWGLTSSAMLTLTVTPENDAPTVTAAAGAPDGSADLVTIPEDTSIVLALTDFGTFADVDGDALAKIEITGLPTDGRLQYDSGSGFTNVSATGMEVTAANITAGKLRFVPDANENGSPYATFTFKVSDGTTYSASSYTVTVNVTPVNDAPVANNDNTISGGTYAAFAVESGCHVTGTDQSGATLTNAGSNQSGNVRTNDTDVDTGTTLTVTAAASIAANDSKAVTAGSTSASNYATVTGLYGSLRIGADGSYVYLPANTNAKVQALQVGDVLTETFTYTVSDGSSTATATLTAVIKGSNDAPDARDDYDTLQETAGYLDGAVTIYGATSGNVKPNDTDPDASSTFTVTSASGPTTYTLSTSFDNNINNTINGGPSAFGKVQVESSPGSGTYVTLLDPSGAEVRVAAISGGGSSVTVTLSDTSQLLTYPTGSLLRLFKANNTDYFGGTYNGNTATPGAGVSVTAGTAGTLTGQYGELIIDADGSYTYKLTTNTLADGQSYLEKFNYTISDGTCTDTATLYVKVNGTTTAIMADDTVTVAEDSGTRISGALNVVSNDTVNSSTPTGNAVASFQWNGQSANADSSLTVSGVGVLTINADGTFTFEPVDNYTGAVPVATYVLATSGASATLALTIQPANDAPTVTASTDAPGGSVDLITTPEDTPIVLALSDFGNFADVDGDALVKIDITGLPTDGHLEYDSGSGFTTVSATGLEVTAANITAGKLRFVPDANENGSPYATFTFEVNDGTTNSASSYTVTVNVTPVNDPPVNTVPATQVLNATPTTAFTTTLAFNSGNGNAITVVDVENSLSTLVLSVSHGTLAATAGTGVTVSGSGTGTLTLTGTDKDNLNAVLATLQYTANDLFSGNDQLRIQTRDSGGLTDLDTVTLTVDADNRPLTVTGSTVNEASPYLMFTVAGVQGQYVQLSVAGVSATLGLDALPKLQYYAGVGTGWVNYTEGSFIKLPSATTPVRLAVLQDKLDEGSETLTLTARNQAATAHDGTGTIRDDGQGDIYLEDATSLTPSNFTDPLDDDRPLTITDPSDATLNGIVVNEDSPYGVLKVTGATGQKVQLSLVNGSAADADHGLLTNNSGTTEVEVYNGAGWVKYTTGEWVTLTGTSLLVRVAIKDDAVYEGPETLGVLATNTGGQTISGTIVIVDDGTGKVYPGDDSPGADPGAFDPSPTLDNDLTVTVTGYGPVNEGSTWAMFKVDGSQGAPILLGVAGSGTTQATTTGFTIQYSTNGTTWKAYSADAPPVVPGALGGGTGSFYVRVNITSEADGTYETSETFSLTGTVGAGATPAPYSSAQVAIVDAGNGTLYTGDFTGATPAEDSSSTKDDDSSIGVSSPTVNEASPYAVFVVNATPGSSLTLTVVEGSGAGFADIDQTQLIKYWDAAANGGLGQWATYSSSVVVPDNGTLLVRVDIQAEQDSPAVDEANETFQLRVSNGPSTASGTATIVDDGNGTIYPAGNPTNATTPQTNTTLANLDDDRALAVNSIRVNEASTHAVFEVTGIAGQLAKLTRANGTAIAGATTPTDGSVDYGTGLEYWHASNGWVVYTPNSWALIPAGNLLYVRTTLVNDTAAEGDQTFTLAATNTGGRATTGTATIDDTGGGVIYTFDPTTNAPTGTTTTGLNTDAAAPPPPPFTANLDPTTDTGALDNVTRITEPEFTLNGGTYLQPGRTARLVDPSGAVIGSAPVTTTEAQSGKINLPTGQLDDGTYIFTAQILDANGNVVASAPVTVTIVTDRDGVAPSIELSANGGDYNRDGILDWEQNNVAQLPVTSYADYLQGRNAPDATFGAILAGRPDASKPGGVALDAGAQLVGISLAPLSAGAPLPTGTRAVSDLYKFSVTSVAGGQLTDIDVRPGLQTQTVIDLPAGVQANAYLKYNATTRTWQDFTNPAAQYGLVDGAALLDTNGDGRIDRIVLTLTDGGPGDEDGVVNGTIVDPGLLALTGPVITGPSGGPGAAASEKTVPENTLPVTRFTANEPVSWKVTGGSEMGEFSIAADGQLTFKAAPDYEAPRDADYNNSYLLQVEATNVAGARACSR